MNLSGKADLKLISEFLGLNYHTLRKYAQMSDFPEIQAKIGNTRIYDVSEVAKYLGVVLKAK